MPPFVLALLKWLPAVVSAGSSLFSGLTQFKMNRKLMGSDDWWNAQTGESLTTAQTQTNEFNAAEAEKNRVWQTEMSNTEYQRSVADMKAAGVNPALAMSNGGASTPSGSAASSGSVQPTASMSDLMQIAMLPMQMKLMNQQIRGEQLANDEKEIDLKFLNQEKQFALNLTAAQIASVKSSLLNDQVQRELHRSGISLNAAQEALTVQQSIAESIDNETRGALNDALLAYRAAETAFTEQKTKESEENVKVLRAQVNELYSRALLQAAERGVLTQEEQRVMMQTKVLKYDAKMKKFVVDHQEVDRVINIVDTVVDDVTDVAGTAGSLIIGRGLLQNGRNRQQPSGLLLPNSTRAFEQNYNIR